MRPKPTRMVRGSALVALRKEGKILTDVRSVAVAHLVCYRRSTRTIIASVIVNRCLTAYDETVMKETVARESAHGCAPQEKN